MRIQHAAWSFCALVVSLSAGAAQAGVIWAEAVDGDLSNNRLAPTAVSLMPGDNMLTATSTGSADREFVRITVPAGGTLTNLVLTAYAGLDGTSFVGIQAGDTMTVDPNNPDVALLLGWTHFGSNFGSVPQDYLADLGQGAGAQGFAPPLGPGNYTLWIQQASGNATTYTWNFVVVPAPGAAGGVLALALAGVLRHRR